MLKIPLNFLEKGHQYIARIYGDSLSTDWNTNPESVELTQFIVNSNDTITAPIAKAGGQAIEITPSESGALPPVATSLKQYNQLAVAKMKVFAKQKTYGLNRVKHLAIHKVVKLIYPFSNLYPAAGINALTDGNTGSLNLSDGGWQGYQGVDLKATIDLKAQTTIQHIQAGFLNAPNDWIFFPSHIVFSVSADGIHFTPVGEINPPASKPGDLQLKERKNFEATFIPIKVKYVRVEAKNLKICPSWHPGAGKNAWIFAEEIGVE